MKANRLMGFALWASLVLSMLASMHHVAASFGYLEQPGFEWMGWAAAVAIDSGIVTLTYGLRVRRKANRGRTAMLRLAAGVIFLMVISIVANVTAALSVRPDAIFQAVAFAATLPIIVILLSDIASSDDARAAHKIEQADAKNSEVTELRRQLAEMTRQRDELVAKLADMTRQRDESAASLAEMQAIPVATDRSKASFMMHMNTGNGDRPAGVPDIVKQYGVSERTAQRWWSEWQSAEANK